MSTLEATMSMLEVLSEEDLLRVQNFARCLFMSQNSEYPFRTLTKGEILKQLSTSRQQYVDGNYKDAETFGDEIMEKYGL